MSFCYLGWWTDELHDDCEARSNAEAKLFGAGKQRCSYLFMSKFARIVYILASALLVAMIVRHCINGFPWVALILGLPSICCCWFFASMEKHFKDTKAGGDILERDTIVFEGKVRAGRPCVCSWPGKYESAWDALVQSSREGDLSAAVVFLPKGSRLFGVHEKIPWYEVLRGEFNRCWCTHLYGERKPWGCKWWSLWVQNIEEAVRKKAELQVYFFEKKKGQGKVANYATAGQEHMRREAIWKRREEFEKSKEFQSAVQAGFQNLSKGKRGDSSSQYSREWQRLFFAWLPQEDRQFLEASEGLGNSQKAEVAWLEKKGYEYTEVEVDVSQWQFSPRHRLR